MSIEANKELLAGYVREIWERGDITALYDYLSDDFKRHISPTLPPLDRDGQVERLTGFRNAFPDITLTVEEVTAEDDRLAFRATIQGTHRGEFAGLAPTGRQFQVGLVDVIRVEDGRFAEQWGGPDTADLLRQLGAAHRNGD